ncbi:MAG: glycosyltransferase family 2 protein, partial [Candidatus Roizmanbacteria bacterium]|nr:glycosyltransferase family 2 protein [Candidatus Roizmanbacteria bacterium]
MPSNNSLKDTIELSIIVLSYNTAALTKQTVESVLKSLKSSQVGYEIIVFDNASHDKSIQLLESVAKNHIQVRVIPHPENLGFSKGNNEAVTLARGSYILFLNSDIIVQDDAISKLFEYYKNNEQSIHFLGGKLFNKNGSLQPSGGPFYSLPVVFGALFAKGDHWGFSRQSPDKITRIDWVSGACILTTKKIFSKLNGFDEKIFMYMDEIDLLYRAKKMHYNT